MGSAVQRIAWGGLPSLPPTTHTHRTPVRLPDGGSEAHVGGERSCQQAFPSVRNSRQTFSKKPSSAGRYLSSQMRQLWSVVVGFEVGLVDPELGRHDRWVWSASESLGVGVVGGGQGVLPVLVDRVGGAEVDRGRGVPRDPGMMVDVVVLVE